MLEKLMLAAAMTLLLNFFLGISARQTDSPVILGQIPASVSSVNSTDAVQIHIATYTAANLD